MYIQLTKVRQWERGKRRDHPEEGATTTGEVKLGTHREGTGVNDSVFLVTTHSQKAERVCALFQASPQQMVYVVEEMEHLLLSKKACTDLGIIGNDLPTIGTYVRE